MVSRVTVKVSSVKYWEWGNGVVCWRGGGHGAKVFHKILNYANSPICSSLNAIRYVTLLPCAIQIFMISIDSGLHDKEVL